MPFVEHFCKLTVRFFVVHEIKVPVHNERDTENVVVEHNHEVKNFFEVLKGFFHEVIDNVIVRQLILLHEIHVLFFFLELIF